MAMSTFSGGRKRNPLPANAALLANQGRYQVRLVQVSPAVGTPGYPVSAVNPLTGILSRSGTFRLVGTLSDGAKVTASADLQESGQMAIFELLDAKLGSLATTLVWSDMAPEFTSSDGVWFRPVTNQGAFPFGWPDGLILSFEGEP
jgi:hypothetical protein